MTMIYVVPTGTLSAESATILARSQVPVIGDGILGAKLIKAAAVAKAVLQVTEDELILLTRHAAHLLDEAPLVLVAVPGLVYPGPWMMTATRIHPVDWLTLEASLTKAGFIANDPATLGARAKEGAVIEGAIKSTTSFFEDDDDDMKEPELGELDAG